MLMQPSGKLTSHAARRRTSLALPAPIPSRAVSGYPGRRVTGQPTRLCLSRRYTLLEGVGVSGPGGFDTVLVVDFGAQYAQLIARRVRECHVYSEIVPSTMPVSEMLAKQPKAIILSGGPSSVYAPGAPAAPAGLFGAGVPALGICYGHQVMVRELGGTVERTGAAEYGGTPLHVLPAAAAGRLLSGLGADGLGS